MSASRARRAGRARGDDVVDGRRGADLGAGEAAHAGRVVEDGQRVHGDRPRAADGGALVAADARVGVDEARPRRDEVAGQPVQRRRQELLHVPAHRLERALRLDGVAGEAVGIVEVEEPAARRRGDRVDVAALVGGAVGERRVERQAVAGARTASPARAASRCPVPGPPWR